MAEVRPLTEVERLEIEIDLIDRAIQSHEVCITKYNEERDKLVMNLNRARRLEREELQDGKQ